MPVAGLVRVERISKSYGRQLAVEGVGVTFSIAPGQIVGFVGPNGACKSTTLRVLTGLVRSDSGSVYLDGIDQQSDPTGFRAMGLSRSDESSHGSHNADRSPDSNSSNPLAQPGARTKASHPT